ncbi:MAG: DUF4870 domain-containing protein [Armatimonadota bacterium]|nr:DUF4870 domain-containing protein [Armatimonadota bacterium]
MSTQPPSSDQTNKLLAALSYPIWIVALIVVLTDMKKDPFMKHHGWTALFWSIAWVVVYIALMILGNIPLLGWLAVIVGGPILWIAWLVLSIYYALQAYNGKQVSIPVVSDFAKKYAV